MLPETLEQTRQWFLGLSDADKVAVIRIVWQHKPASLRMKEILGYEQTTEAFDIDVVDGSIGEGRIFQLGKVEVKEDFSVSKTGNVAIELSCDGLSSGLTVSEADHWGFLFSGGEYNEELKLFISRKRLERITRSCYCVFGGDGNRSFMALVPVENLVWSDSKIEEMAKKKGAQVQLPV